MSYFDTEGGIMENRKEMLQELRKLTNYTASLSECMSALSKASGDFEKAKNILAESGYIDNSKSRFYVDVSNDAPSKWAYILTKANRYLKHGPEIYRKSDTLEMPSEDWNEQILQEIEACFRQFLDGKGYKMDNPVRNISVVGFYAATETLHFQVIEQAGCMGADGNGILDDMLFEHVVDKETINLFNSVS
jgi:hypothetical protein